MDILLINAPSITNNTGKTQTLPLGIGYLFSSLKKNGYEPGMVDLQAKPDLNYLKGIFEKYNPGVIGVSAVTESITNAFKIAKLYKEIKPDGLAILGGVHATFTPQESLEKSAFDLVCRGEGEETVVEIMRHHLEQYGQIEDIKGISYKNNGLICHNPDRELLVNLDVLPFPEREELGPELYQIPYSLISSRGCPGLCNFCVARILLKGKYRTRSVENVLEEIKTFDLERHNVIVFQDSTFTADRKRLKAMCTGLQQLPKPPFWWCESRVDALDSETVDLMKASGCQGIEFGVESGSQVVLDGIRKNIQKDDVRQAVQLCTERKIKSLCTIMIGHHCDTEETIIESIDFARELESFGAEVYYNIVTPYPGTPIETEKIKNGIQIIADNYDEYTGANAIMNTPNLTAVQIQSYFFDAKLKIKRTQE